MRVWSSHRTNRHYVPWLRLMEVIVYVCREWMKKLTEIVTSDVEWVRRGREKEVRIVKVGG